MPARAELYVCMSCWRHGIKREAEGESTDGKRLFDELASRVSELGQDAPVRPIPVLCFANCERGCSVAIASPGKWSYLLGELGPEHAADLLTYAKTYNQARAGVVLPSKRPASLEHAVIARFPAHLDPSQGRRRMTTARIPATIITGFLGAGKTTLLRHVLENAKGKRLAIIVNEFGSVGVDGETLRSCGLTNCPEENIVELSNGCLCCTVAEDFIPTMLALIERAEPPEHILIETSGLALPKPLVKAFDWPDIRSRLTVDGVIAVVDAPAVAAGRFADDPEAVARQREADPSVEHDNPLAEVYEDQLMAADLIVLNKTDLIDAGVSEKLKSEVVAIVPRAVKVIAARDGRVDVAVLLGLHAAAEDDLAARPSHHDAAGLEHEHDDFESFVVMLPEIDDR